MSDIRANEEKAKECERTLTVLADVRRDCEEDIDTIITFINHSRRRIKDRPQGKGKKTGMEVYDGTAFSARNLLVDGMVGYTCSRSQRWFAFDLPGIINFPRHSQLRRWSGGKLSAIPDVKMWLEDAAEVIYYAFHRSNFYDTIPEFISDGASAGTAHFQIEEDLGKGRIIFTVPHFRECYIAENHFGEVDTRYRVYKLNVRQLADKFGLDVMVEANANFQRILENNPFEEMEIIHAVYPRKYYDFNIKNSQNMPISSLWVLRSPLRLLSEGGYNEMPAISWRWRKNSDEWYGRGPGWDAIVEVLTAQQIAKDNLLAGHKMVDPAMVGPEDLRGRVNTAPGGWTWVTNIEKMAPRPIDQNIQLPFGKDQLDRLDNAIKEHFHVNFFLMLYQASFNKVELTATQVLGMQGEQAAVLGTRVGRLESEAFNPIIDRVFSIEVRAGRIPPPPQILLDLGVGRIEVDYMGPLSQAQRRMAKNREIRAGLESAAIVAQTFPESMDIVDGDETMKEALDAAGFPAKCILPDGQVAEIRDARLQQQMMEKRVEMAAALGKGMRGMEKRPEPGSPLETAMASEEGGMLTGEEE